MSIAAETNAFSTLEEIAKHVGVQQRDSLNRQEARIASLTAQRDAALAALEQEKQKVKALSGEAEAVLRHAYPLTVIEITDEKVYLTTEGAPMINQFMIERSQFERGVDLQRDEVLMVKISATRQAQPVPSPAEHEEMRREMGEIAEELGKKSHRGPLVL